MHAGIKVAIKKSPWQCEHNMIYTVEITVALFYLRAHSVLHIVSHLCGSRFYVYI